MYLFSYRFFIQHPSLQKFLKHYHLKRNIVQPPADTVACFCHPDVPQQQQHDCLLQGVVQLDRRRFEQQNSWCYPAVTSTLHAFRWIYLVQLQSSPMPCMPTGAYLLVQFNPKGIPFVCSVTPTWCKPKHSKWRSQQKPLQKHIHDPTIDTAFAHLHAFLGKV